ncbi:DNA recombination protein RmuC [Notoacmeibacter sp. MSK16QG-6]|uniref:DNA recombination protein RmuC n=1 Tax=Notoacmeibacter sp. MSK16QG-6 TaxID=2957982 RepID=UPI0020A14636|nr:DNA recombination protein RmuC [Notoacmeibacter sp. MSK16QG-6]MCP1198733.1 DNA recombination protein RmuC [Notoacmeibacter sp. MSK16QG-6]
METGLSLTMPLAMPFGMTLPLWAAGGALLVMALFVGRLTAGRQSLSRVEQQQAELAGRLGALADHLGERQEAFDARLARRLEHLSGRLGESLTRQNRATQTNLTELSERLAVIDSAQRNIGELAGEMMGLQAILTDKQTRGLFGERRLEAILHDALPVGTFDLQTRLPTGVRPDALVRLPGGAPPLVIDAKFPLEAWRAMGEADDDLARDAARKRFRRDMAVHVDAVGDKYVQPGETQDFAFLFVPSESVFADLHEHFGAVVERASRRRVMLVSPSLLMLALGIVHSMRRDEAMAREAHRIQAEVAALMEEVSAVDTLIAKLQTHFSHSQKDIDSLARAIGKLSRRGDAIASVELSEREECAVSLAAE